MLNKHLYKEYFRSVYIHIYDFAFHHVHYQILLIEHSSHFEAPYRDHHFMVPAILKDRQNATKMQ